MENCHPALDAGSNKKRVDPRVKPEDDKTKI